MENGVLVELGLFIWQILSSPWFSFMQRVQKMCLLACYKMVDVVIIGEESFDRHFFEGLKRQLVGNISGVDDDGEGKHGGDEVFDMMWNF